MIKGLPEGYRPQVDFGGRTGDAEIVLGGQQVRLAAWRKKLLYVLLAVLLCMAVANALTTLWLLSHMSFNTRGLGSLQVEVEGVRLLGKSWLDETTNARSIQSRRGRRLSLYGYHNSSLYALDDHGRPLTALLLDQRDAVAFTRGFIVEDAGGAEVFRSDVGGSSTAAHTLTLTDAAGALLNKSTQAPLLLGLPKQQLLVSSKTRHVDVRAARDLSIESRDGDIAFRCLESLGLETTEGQIRFQSPSVYTTDLPISGEDHAPYPPDGPATALPVAMGKVSSTISPETQIPRPPITQDFEPSNVEQSRTDVYQVCVCPNGRLFLSDPHFICSPDGHTCR